MEKISEENIEPRGISGGISKVSQIPDKIPGEVSRRTPEDVWK